MLSRFGSAVGAGTAPGDSLDSDDDAVEAAAVAVASDGAALAPALLLLVPPEHPAPARTKIRAIDCGFIRRSYRETF